MFKLNAKLVRELLCQRGLSLRQFVAQSGINKLTASKLVRDGETVTLKTISALVKFFGVDCDDLILKEKGDVDCGL